MTIRERRGTLAGRKLCFVGDGSSMANRFIVGGLLAGMQVTCVCPEAYRPAADEIFDEAENRLHVQKAVLAILLAGK